MTDSKTPGIGSGKAGPGRPKGMSNKTTYALKEAILKAAETIGEDGKGKDKLVGYLVGLGKRDDKAFAGLLGKVLPMTVAGDPNAPLGLTVNIKTF